MEKQGVKKLIRKRQLQPTEQLKNVNRFKRAHEQWERGKLTSAFRLLLEGAKAGDTAAQTTLGTFYSDGLGVRPNRNLALHWYRRAYRHGTAAAAHNIGIMYRNEHKRKKAFEWFKRAAKLEDIDSNLDIATLHIEENEWKAAVPYLRKVAEAKPGTVTEASREEAACLLRQSHLQTLVTPVDRRKPSS